MTNSIVTKDCDDLNIDDAVTRARTATPTVERSIISDANYLRSDGHAILDILNNDQTIFNVIGPRRWGKTSFLERVKRHAGNRGRRVVMAAFNAGVDVVITELARFFEAEADLVSLSTVIRSLPSNDPDRPLVLLEEGASQIDLANEDGQKMRSLLALFASVAREGRITLCYAEIPQFFAKCLDGGNELNRPSELVADNPILLGPMPESVRQAFLAPVTKVGHEDLISAIGFVPGESQSLRTQFKKLEDRMDAEALRAGFEDSWSRVLKIVWHNLAPEEQAVLWHACKSESPSTNELSTLGGVNYRSLEAWGLVRTHPGKKYTAGSVATRDLLLGLMSEPEPSTLRRVFKTPDCFNLEPGPVGPQPTFEDDLVIHQIADLHFGRLSEKCAGKWLSEYYLDYLKSQDPKNLPHIIVLCGDLTSVASGEEFMIANDFICALKGSLGGGIRNQPPLIRPLYKGGQPDFSKQIVIVPGNHDMQWSEERKNFDEAIEAFRRFCNGLGCLTPLSDPPAVYLEPANITLVACNSAHLGGVDISSRFLDLSPELRRQGGETLEKFLEQAHRFIDKIPSIRALIEKNKLDTIDESFRTKSELMNFMFKFTWGFVDPEFLSKIPDYMSRAHKENCFPIPHGARHVIYQPEIKIGILHHNISSLVDGNIFTELFNSKNVARAFLKEDINIILHGHQHQFNLSAEKYYDKISSDSEYMIGKTLHCLGSDSIGVRSVDLPSPTFNEIRVLCDSEETNHRTVEIRRIEYVVRSNGTIERQSKVGQAELTLEGPTVVRNA